jgi:hypothetical protein
MKGKDAFELALCGPDGGMRGKDALEFTICGLEDNKWLNDNRGPVGVISSEREPAYSPLRGLCSLSAANGEKTTPPQRAQ